MRFVWQILAIIVLVVVIVFAARVAGIFIIRCFAPKKDDLPSGLPIFLLTVVLALAGIAATAIAVDELGIFK